MNPRVKTVQCLDDFSLVLEFLNGERRRFDCRPFLQIGVFRELQNFGYFQQARVEMGTVSWPHEQDFCPDTLYLESVPVHDPSSMKGQTP